MSRIRGADTRPEVALRTTLEARGLFGDSNAKAPAGKPDIAFIKEKAAVFIDGCFWHGCPLHYVRPRTREAFWSAKLVINIERDSRLSVGLTEAGWKVIRLWEHEVVLDIDMAAENVERIMRGEANQSWISQRRVRRVVEISDHAERREFVTLGDPAVVVEVMEGPRVTAKAHARKQMRPPG
jgi:DNA mismatch endonuclease, patch repair protein